MERQSHALAWSADAGPDADDFPSGVSIAPFTWEHLGSPLSMEYVGGFAGVSQDADAFAVRPEIGWAVRRATPSGVIELTDAVTGLRIHHVLLVGGRGPLLDEVVGELRQMAGATGVAGECFDVRCGDSVLRFHEGFHPNVAPSGLVLLLSGRGMDWSASEADLPHIERALLDTGRLRDLPLLGYMDDGPVDFEDLPAPVQALCQHVRTFVLMEPRSSCEVVDALSRRLRA